MIRRHLFRLAAASLFGLPLLSCLGHSTWADEPVVSASAQPTPAKASAQPLRALLICGGCCHDYKTQHKILFEGIQSRANIRVDVWWTDDGGVNPPLTIYNNVNWANNYDVIIHDECAANEQNPEVIKNILQVHEKTPAVHLHCALHSFRNQGELSEQWFKHIGIHSSGHGPRLPIDVQIVDHQHPIMNGQEDFRIEQDELYNNQRMFTAHALAKGTQKVKRKGKEEVVEAVVVWTNENSGPRSFSVSLGHFNEVVESDVYLDLVVRGTLWACDQLNDDYLKTPYTGKNKIAFEKGVAATPKKTPPKPPVMPPNATIARLTASSSQPKNQVNFAMDGKQESRWSAANSSFPQWLQLEFKEPKKLTQAKILWESKGVYQYLISGSADQKNWTTVLDKSENLDAESKFHPLTTDQAYKYYRVEGLKGPGKNGCSIREFKCVGDGVQNVWPGNKQFQPFHKPTPAKKK